jgi:monofunctional biosynthetic peptidoglycan transglycosylase
MWRSRPIKLIARLGTGVRWGLRLLLLFLVLDLFYLALTWPDWQGLARGPIPKSAFMRDYEREQAHHGRATALRWQPVSLTAIPRHVQRAVVLAEDSRFYGHSGFDLIAFKEAMDYNLNEGRFAVGASTISQQTVKNLFLSPSKTPLRKWHELVLTWGMERHLSKQRIMELYLNIAEFGPGIYGVHAAAQAYWGTAISNVDARQAAELAATLPSPGKNNPATRTGHFEKRSARILRLLLRFPGEAAGSIVDFKAPLELGAEETETVDGDAAIEADAEAEDEKPACPEGRCVTETERPLPVPPAPPEPSVSETATPRPG